MNRKAVLFFVISVCTAACRQDMNDQPKYKPLAASSLFSDGRAARPLVADTVARGHAETDTAFYRGKKNGNYITTIPIPVTMDLLKHGQERYDIFCAVCHDRAGTGQGMVVQRGFPAPASLHTERLRRAPAGYFFDVMTNGFGRMYPFSDRLTAEDRWAVTAYIRALQRSRNATLVDVPPGHRKDLTHAE